MECIFCDEPNEAKSIEHIVSESFGNKKYLMPKGSVCDVCNAKFSKFEGTALTNTVFVMERARFGIETKKGNNVKGKVGDLRIEGDKNFKENFLNIDGLNEKNFIDFNPNTQRGYLIVPSFDKSEVATSKLLLKIGLESMFKSQKTIFMKYNFKELKDFLTNKNNFDWPFLTTDFEMQRFRSIPKYTDKYELNLKHCELKFTEFDENSLLFKFKFGAIPMTINLLNRNLDWLKINLELDKDAVVYPVHFKNKISKTKVD